MDDKMLEKRLDLLNKSYKKLPSQTRTNDILKAIKEEQSPKRKRVHIHWPYVASFIGVLLISSVLMLQFTMEKTESRKHKEQNSNLSQRTGEMDEELLAEIQDAKSLYELRKTQAKEQLGFREATFSRTKMEADAKGQLTYIESIQTRDLPLDTKFKWVQRGKRIIESAL